MYLLICYFVPHVLFGIRLNNNTRAFTGTIGRLSNTECRIRRVVKIGAREENIGEGKKQYEEEQEEDCEEMEQEKPKGKEDKRDWEETEKKEELVKEDKKDCEETKQTKELDEDEDEDRGVGNRKTNCKKRRPTGKK